ncbi:hypothetical protein ANO11243_017880 [Dothideomycetidae sp. 11243]|nr:hypothetical protein ANO11243_017880 [fungal sp. No.11243]
MVHITGSPGLFQFQAITVADPTKDRDVVAQINLGYLLRAASIADIVALAQTIRIKNDDREFNCQHWVYSAVQELAQQGYLTCRTYDKVVNDMIDVIMKAEDEDEDDADLLSQEFLSGTREVTSLHQAASNPHRQANIPSSKDAGFTGVLETPKTRAKCLRIFRAGISSPESSSMASGDHFGSQPYSFSHLSTCALSELVLICGPAALCKSSSSRIHEYANTLGGARYYIQQGLKSGLFSHFCEGKSGS